VPKEPPDESRQANAARGSERDGNLSFDAIGGID
jgi:hypothetical protein